MYYRNKSTFYIRHFGSKFVVIASIAAIFLFGTYSYISASELTPKAMFSEVKDSTEIVTVEVANNNSKEETKNENKVEDKKEESKPVKVEENKPAKTVVANKPNKTNKLKYTKFSNVTLKDLKSYKVSGGVKVLEVVDTNKIVVEDIDSTKYTINLIGVTGLDETKYSREGVIATINSLNDMLKGKLVQVEFDIDKKVNDAEFNAYVYFNKGLLNADFIEKGYCDIKVENSNTNRIGDLLIALKDAKENKVGIWKNI